MFDQLHGHRLLIGGLVQTFPNVGVDRGTRNASRAAADALARPPLTNLSDRAFIRIKCQQQAGAVLSCNHFPRQTRYGAFQRPKKIEADIPTCAFCTNVSSDRAKFAELLQRKDSSNSQHLRGLW